MENQELKDLNASGYKELSSDYFTGKAWLKSLLESDENTDCWIGDVLFEPGTRNNWHIHPSNQILIVKEGICFYQEEGQPIQKINAGGVINVLPHTKHWHGASPDARMIHTAIGINTQLGVVEWLEPVNDEQYSGI